MSLRSVEVSPGPVLVSRRTVLQMAATAGITTTAALARDVIHIPRIPFEVLPFIEKPDTYRAYNAFFEGTDEISSDEREEILGSIESIPLTDEISLGWSNGGKPKDIDVSLNGSQFVYAQIRSQFDPDYSMPVVSVLHGDDEFLVAMMQSELNNDGTVYFPSPEQGRHTFTFSPTEYSYLLQSDKTTAQLYEIRAGHPIAQGILNLLPDRIGEIAYSPAHPVLGFREDISAAVNILDIKKNETEYRVGIWHKCPKEKGGSKPDNLMDRSRNDLVGAEHSVVDHDAMVVGVFSPDGFMETFGWQEDTRRQQHDILTLPAYFLSRNPNGSFDTSVQRVRDHGLFVQGVEKKRGYAPLPEEFHEYDEERIAERNFALGVIGLRQQIIRGRMSPYDHRVQDVIDKIGRDLITPQMFYLR